MANVTESIERLKKHLFQIQFYIYKKFFAFQLQIVASVRIARSPHK